MSQETTNELSEAELEQAVGGTSTNHIGAGTFDSPDHHKNPASGMHHRKPHDWTSPGIVNPGHDEISGLIVDPSKQI